jgi:transcriptional regulator
MARNADDFIKSLPAASRRKVERRAALLIEEEMTLQQLRKLQGLTQEKIAKALGVRQKQVSEVEARTDMHISTVRRQVEAIGGKLQLVVTMPGKKKPIVLSGLGELRAR